MGSPSSAAIVNPPARPGALEHPVGRRVCLVAHLAFPALTGAAGVGGGVELQTSLLARWLARRGHRVSLIVWDEGQAEGLEVEGVRVITVCRRDAGWPGVRFFHPRWSSLTHALRAADAEVYYHNGAEYVTGQVALWCRAHGRRFVFSSASNSDCDSAPPLLPAWRERVLYKMGLRRADLILVQTRLQQQMLRANFGRDGIVMPMPCEDTSQPSSRPSSPPHGLEREKGLHVLWIGRICDVKRPDRLLDVAEQCAELRFDVIGAEDGSAYARRVIERARRIPNVTVHGALSRTAISGALEDALCLCCTSDIEGFPNTFLEAWSHGTPVVSTYDPDGLIATGRLGRVSSPQALAENIRALVSSKHEWVRASQNARQYYLDHHTVDAAMPGFESLFRDLLQGPHG